ncbi:hypothetical protein JXQ70_00450, partial [bacterium]|nr:hypothetical protein [bacterium]
LLYDPRKDPKMLSRGIDYSDPLEGKVRWKPKIFHNFHGVDFDGLSLARDVALYTCSAPTYFPSADGFIDGGVFANNPSNVAIAQAISSANEPSERADLDELVLLSVGTGISLNYIKGDTLNWGYAQWVKPLLNVLMDGVETIAHYQATQLLCERYHRLQIYFDKYKTIKLDNVKKLGSMDRIARNHDLGPTIQWLMENWI